MDECLSLAIAVSVLLNKMRVSLNIFMFVDTMQSQIVGQNRAKL
jgi:hypothetical protein